MHPAVLVHLFPGSPPAASLRPSDSITLRVDILCWLSSEVENLVEKQIKLLNTASKLAALSLATLCRDRF